MKVSAFLPTKKIERRINSVYKAHIHHEATAFVMRNHDPWTQPPIKKITRRIPNPSIAETIPPKHQPSKKYNTFFIKIR